MSVSSTDGRAARRKQVRELMDRAGVAAVVLRRPANFAWYTGGGNSRVEYVAPEGVADVVLTADDEWVLTSTIEAPRMRAEEAPSFEVVEYAWEEGPDSALRELVGDGKLGADVELAGGPRHGCGAGGRSIDPVAIAPGRSAEPDAVALNRSPELGSSAHDLSAELDALRRVLDEDAIARLHAIGADLTAALAEAADGVSAGMSEHEAAAAIAAACRVRGLVPTVLLAATHERIARHRHALPAGATIERRAMLVASAQRGGLYANLTRMVWLGAPDPDTVRRQDACDTILARTRVEATRPGRSLAEVFDDIRGFYADAGFPDEWRLHHQGGIAGYASREVIATPYTDVEIEPGMAFSWNPSVTGAKAEDTFVLTAAGPEVVAGASTAVA